MLAESILIAAALAVAVASRPWRLYGVGTGAPPDRETLVRRLAPSFALLAILPWVWILPGPAPVAGQLHWSGACLATLMLGWPVAVPALIAVALLAGLIGGLDGPAITTLACWQGVVPATLSLAIGVLLRRGLGERIFVYLLGRAFLGTVLSLFLAGLLETFWHAQGGLGPSAFVARWLMAWGDAVVTGMLATVFVAFAPAWLATWSDARYLRRPQ